MEETKVKKEIEITKKGKIILGIIGLLVVGLIIIIIPKNKIEGLSIEMAMPNDGKIVDDPILGTTLELKVDGKIKLLETKHPTKSIVKTEFISENKEIAYIDEKNNIVGKSEGTTKIYSQTKNGKVKSNVIEITIVK